jgi:hypothetical protein
MSLLAFRCGDRVQGKIGILAEPGPVTPNIVRRRHRSYEPHFVTQENFAAGDVWTESSVVRLCDMLRIHANGKLLLHLDVRCR